MTEAWKLGERVANTSRSRRRTLRSLSQIAGVGLSYVALAVTARVARADDTSGPPAAACPGTLPKVRSSCGCYPKEEAVFNALSQTGIASDDRLKSKVQRCFNGSVDGDLKALKKLNVGLDAKVEGCLTKISEQFPVYQGVLADLVKAATTVDADQKQVWLCCYRQQLGQEPCKKPTPVPVKPKVDKRRSCLVPGHAAVEHPVIDLGQAIDKQLILFAEDKVKIPAIGGSLSWVWFGLAWEPFDYNKHYSREWLVAGEPGTPIVPGLEGVGPIKMEVTKGSECDKPRDLRSLPANTATNMAAKVPPLRTTELEVLSGVRTFEADTTITAPRIVIRDKTRIVVRNGATLTLDSVDLVVEGQAEFDGRGPDGHPGGRGRDAQLPMVWNAGNDREYFSAISEAATQPDSPMRGGRGGEGEPGGRGATLVLRSRPKGGQLVLLLKGGAGGLAGPGGRSCLIRRPNGETFQVPEGDRGQPGAPGGDGKVVYLADNQPTSSRY